MLEASVIFPLDGMLAALIVARLDSLFFRFKLPLLRPDTVALRL
jgi:hypothetical protein